MRDIISSIDNGQSRLWIATTSLLGLSYLDSIVQSLPSILTYRKTHSIEVTDVNFEDKCLAEGLSVFDDQTILPKMMGEPFVHWIGSPPALSILWSLQLQQSDATKVTGQATPQDWFIERPKRPWSVPMQDVRRLFFHDPRSDACTSRDAHYVLE